MAKEYILKDRYGKDHTFNDETIYVRGADGELMPFTQGTSGGSSDDVRYVTFMSHDGLIEYGKKAVAVGDDCADPIARGVFDTPTRESDAQYSYTFYGWATTPNGAADSAALKAVEEDRTVYANFASAVRYYTITYYDSDGTTVLKTESLAYGTMPSYAPTKENLMFGGWTPSAVAVTGNASYTAVWEEKVTFATASWAKIAEVCAAGKESECFAVGDKKPITLNYDDGTSETINFTIVDMGVDPLSGGSKAPLTIMADNIVAISPTKLASTSNKGSSTFYENDAIKSFLDRIYESMPEDLQIVIKPYRYYYFEWTGVESVSNIFIAHSVNLGISNTGYGSYAKPDTPNYNAKYKHFSQGGSIRRTKLNDANSDDYWTSARIDYQSGSYTTAYWLAIDGTSKISNMQNGASDSHGVVPCFCI